MFRLSYNHLSQKFTSSATRTQFLPFKRAMHAPVMTSADDTVTEDRNAIKLFVDCDAGVDDAQGLVLAMRSPRVDLVGISAVHGNVGCQKVIHNVARVRHLCGSSAPYFAGCDRPLLGQALPATHWHGEDGLGDVPEVYPEASSIEARSTPGHASVAIVEAARRYRGQLRLVAIGPLTNVAVALKLEPELPEWLHSITIMGGCDGGGNVTPTAEFNFHCDPEAAQIVMSAFKDVQIITWDAVEKLALDWALYDEWLQLDTSCASFLEAIGRVGMAHDKGKDTKWLVCDPLAVAAAISPTLVTAAKQGSCKVELRDTSRRGQSSFDFNVPQEQQNVRVVSDMDMGKVVDMLKEAVT